MPETSRSKLTEVEIKILEARQDGFSFAQLDKAHVRLAADKIILKAAAICGCPTPETDFFAEILTTEIDDYINQFGFGELTVSEIILSMRLNTSHNLKKPPHLEVFAIAFSGACINVDFLSKMLGNYLIYRNSLDRKLQNFIDGHE